MHPAWLATGPVFPLMVRKSLPTNPITPAAVRQIDLFLKAEHFWTRRSRITANAFENLQPVMRSGMDDPNAIFRRIFPVFVDPDIVRNFSHEPQFSVQDEVPIMFQSNCLAAGEQERRVFEQFTSC